MEPVKFARHPKEMPYPGATCCGHGRVRFRVWAPRCRDVAVRTLDPPTRAPVAMAAAGDGWFETIADGVEPGARYTYVLDGRHDRPDPAARALPDGVHGPSEVVDTTAFAWTDGAWRGLPLRDMVLYEIHVGAFTPEGTFDAVIARLERLQSLGVTAIELMPVASFPGARNWGYDGVGLFAPQRTYGGPAGLQRLVDACHARGLAVVLDVVYNHLGPEGNYLAEFGPYFTDRYTTPWGDAVNYDGDDARGVRDFVVANAAYWIREYHIDAIRLDAVHGIFDASPVHILQELNAAVQRLARRVGRIVPVIAESDLNDRRIIDPVRKGGYGLAGQWSDDFHHCVHTLLTGERNGYYQDFGRPGQFVKAYADGFVYDGQHSSYRGRPHGTPAGDIPAERFVVCIQNHDQVGNRAQGERLSSLVDLDKCKLAATALLFSPYVPLLFMGEEYGERSPFLYFTDFQDAALQAAVTRGRQAEFAPFGWTGAVPDPQSLASFCRSKLNWGLQVSTPHAWLWDYYRELLALRRRYPVLGVGGKRRLRTRLEDARILALLRSGRKGAAAFGLFNFSAESGIVRAGLSAGEWHRVVDSGEERFGGFGPKTPERMNLSRRVQVRVDMAPWGAAIFVRAGLARQVVPPRSRAVRPAPLAAPRGSEG
jgi:maltooligosyltrehalose trehalohydrolase